MAKKVLKFKCEQTANNANQSAAVLAIEAAKQPDPAPGEKPKRAAKSVLQVRFAEDLLTFGQDFFKPGKTYQVTFEEVK